MEWQIILALVIGIPIVLFPVAFIWYINAGGIVAAVKKAREKRTVREDKTDANKEVLREQEYEKVLVDTMRRYPWM
jgi:hypothetical protein